ncbi:hypothetical protein B0F90DRAFT_1699495 [Multifurca ochricompacta]|uniref:CCHC-type domain-containing protein n=1 Tax=Multifurca ochricompacta TaxID=376703 RepID=A0AAD4M8W0_9AGAM|nr:hypothetical protein B0F90DRAFT_1699495 [Multifurca ochricompacta]
MTRYTNIGRKRTYLQASFDPNNEELSTKDPLTPVSGILNPSRAQQESNVSELARSSRKRRRKSKGSSETAEEPSLAAITGEKTKNSLAKSMADEKTKRAKRRSAAPEVRRLKRIAERRSNTTCFACREVGHSAKDCWSMRSDANGGGDGPSNIIGICYRCGSRKHNLARCRQPAQPDNPFPFASCFVCSENGHLASSCPKNNGKGVYPNGGSCKLCGETTHLARDCTFRKTEGSAAVALLGTGREAGADEDDFHTIRRKNAEIDRDERGEERARKEAKVLAGALTGVVKPFGKALAKQPKKVVYF